MVNPELQIFKCFGCGEGGDVFVFLQKIEGMEFGEALRELAEKAGVQLTTYKQSSKEEGKDKLIKVNAIAAEYYHYLLLTHKLGEAARKYVKSRGVSDEAVEKFKLGYAPDGWDYLAHFLRDKKKYTNADLEKSGLAVAGKGFYDRFRNRLMFPLNNHRGVTVGFAGRVLPGGDDKTGKYVNTPETEIYHKGELLYGLDVNKMDIKTAGFAVVVEGEMDMIASWQAGVKNVVAIKGSALTGAQVDIIRRYVDTIVLALDADLAGDMAARRGIETAEKAGLVIKVVNAKDTAINPKEYKDPGDWAMADKEGWIKAVEGAIPIHDFYIESAVRRYGLDAVGKGRIGREVLPLIASIDDEIVKAHYVQKLAKVLGVDENDVRNQMRRVGTKNIKTEPKTGAVEGMKPRREVLEEYVVYLALARQDPEALTPDGVGEFIKLPFWKRAIEGLSDYTKGASVKEMVSGLPAELSRRVEEVILREGANEGVDLEREWGKATRELEEVDIRERLDELKAKMDTSAAQKEWVRLAARLTVLTKD